MTDIRALRLEVKKDGFSQLQSGNYKLTMTLNPADLQDNDQALLTDFIKAPMGTRYMIGMAEIGDDEQPKAEPKKERRPFHELPRAHQAGILCQDTRFQDWVGEDCWRSPHAAETAARTFILYEFNIQSRTELNEPRFKEPWEKFVARYREETNQMAEDRS